LERFVFSVAFDRPDNGDIEPSSDKKNGQVPGTSNCQLTAACGAEKKVQMACQSLLARSHHARLPALCVYCSMLLLCNPFPRNPIRLFAEKQQNATER